LYRGIYEKARNIYLGHQEGVGLLVNEVDSHSTVVYDEEKHCIVQPCDVDDKKNKTSKRTGLSCLF
jgi:hypothetical protein